MLCMVRKCVCMCVCLCVCVCDCVMLCCVVDSSGVDLCVLDSLCVEYVATFVCFCFCLCSVSSNVISCSVFA